jgi:hypothetical protein
MLQNAKPYPQDDADRLEAAIDQAIAACGGDARDAVKALANVFRSAGGELKGYARGYYHGRFKTYTG